MDNVKMKHESDKAEVIFRRGLQTELHEWEHVSADKVFLGFFTITLKHIQDLGESSVGRLLSLNSWCGIKSYTISFLSLTQEASQAKTSYVH